MADPFIGEIRMFGGNFAPTGWALCNGQLLPISQNTALFSILGTTFGGNGQTTFGLPDLRGRVPMNFGQGPGLTPRNLGENGGSETVTLLVTQMPAHTHQANASSANATAPSPQGGVWAQELDSQGGTGTGYTGTPNTTMSPQAIGTAGGGQPHQNLQPYLCVNFIIALNGIFPSRS
jgi:microcystin-dependent protein